MGISGMLAIYRAAAQIQESDPGIRKAGASGYYEVAGAGTHIPLLF